MGKRYYCDYCDKTMVDTPTVLKTHNKGLVHQKLVHEHYQQFKDPETILSEESKKRPCLRFPKGQCQFSSLCRYSHYSQEELNVLRNLVAMKNARRTETSQPSFEDLYQNLQKDISERIYKNENETILLDKDGRTHVLPWKYNEVFDSYGENLPPSLKRYRIEDFDNVQLGKWG